MLRLGDRVGSRVGVAVIGAWRVRQRLRRRLCCRGRTRRRRAWCGSCRRGRCWSNVNRLRGRRLPCLDRSRRTRRNRLRRLRVRHYRLQLFRPRRKVPSPILNLHVIAIDFHLKWVILPIRLRVIERELEQVHILRGSRQLSQAAFDIVAVVKIRAACRVGEPR